MNRYVVQGLATDVAAGKTVVVFAPGREARYLMQDCTEYLDTRGLLVQASMSNGREYVKGRAGGSATHVRDLRGVGTPDVILFLSRPSDREVEALRGFTHRVEVLEAW